MEKQIIYGIVSYCDDSVLGDVRDVSFSVYADAQSRDVAFVSLAKKHLAEHPDSWNGRIVTAEDAETFFDEAFCENLVYGYKRVQSELQSYTHELCPFCEEEVALEPILKNQTCPKCQETIKTCSMCECKECAHCSLDKEVKDSEIIAQLSLFSYADKNYYASYEKGFKSVKEAEKCLMSQMKNIFNKHLSLDIDEDEDWSDESFNDKKTRVAYWLNENIKQCAITISNPYTYICHKYDFTRFLHQ